MDKSVFASVFNQNLEANDYGEMLDEHADRYTGLKGILHDAFLRAAVGKGSDRHGNDKDFEEQPILRIQEMVGRGFVLGQIIKKASESAKMEGKAFDDEMLDVIVYAAGAILYARNGGKK